MSENTNTSGNGGDIAEGVRQAQAPSQGVSPSRSAKPMLGGERADDLVPTDPKHPYYIKDHPQHSEAVAAVQRAMRAKHNAPATATQKVPVPDPATDAGAVRANARAQQIAAESNVREYDEHDLRDIRERAGVAPVRLAEPFQKQYDVQAEADVLEFTAREQVPGRLVESMRDFYLREHLIGGGVTDDAIERFRTQFGPHVSARVLDRLVAWARAYHTDPK